MKPLWRESKITGKNLQEPKKPKNQHENIRERLIETKTNRIEEQADLPHSEQMHRGDIVHI